MRTRWSGQFVYMRTNYQSMTESVAIFNHFLGYVAVGAVVVSMLLMIVVSNSFAQYLYELLDMSGVRTAVIWLSVRL